MARLTNVVLTFPKGSAFTPEPFHSFVSSNLAEAGYPNIAEEYLKGSGVANEPDAALQYADQFVTFYGSENLFVFKGLKQVLDFYAAHNSSSVHAREWLYEKTRYGSRSSLEKLVGGIKCSEDSKVKAIIYFARILNENRFNLDSGEKALRDRFYEPADFIAILGEITDEVGMTVIHRLKPEYWVELDYLNNETFLLAIINKEPLLIEQIEQTFERCLVAVKSDGMVLEHVIKPCTAIIEEALRSDGRAIQFVPNPTEKLKMIAVNSNGQALDFIAEHTDELLIEAVRNNSDALRSAKYQTYEIVLAAVAKSPAEIEYVEERFKTDDVVNMAINSAPSVWKYCVDKLKPYHCDMVIEDDPQFSVLGKLPHITAKSLETCMLAASVSRGAYGLRLREERDKVVDGDCADFLDLRRLDAESMAVFLNRGGKYKALPMLEDEAVAIEVVRYNGMTLRKFPVKTPLMCFEAVMNNPEAIKFVPKEMK